MTKRFTRFALCMVMVFTMVAPAFAANGVMPLGGNECPRCGKDGYESHLDPKPAVAVKNPTVCGHGFMDSTDQKWMQEVYIYYSCPCGYGGLGQETLYYTDKYTVCNKTGAISDFSRTYGKNK